MKTLLTTTAALSFLALTLPAAPALASYGSPGENCDYIGHFPVGYWLCEVPVEPDCECIPDALDVLQNLTAAQKATNRIDDFKTVENVVQSAVNIGNSVSIDLEDMPTMGDIEQNAQGWQWASNYIEFGGGGYDGPEFELDEDGALVSDPTQSALNAVNLINVPTLGTAVQNNTTAQTALNTARFEGNTYFPHWSGDVDDLSQSATNVANSISAAGFFTFEDCGCLEIEQNSSSWQLASNVISGASSFNFGSLDSAIQNATNIANSISGSMPDSE